MNRTEQALKNSLVSSIIQVANLFLKFGVRTLFIYYLGKSYLGINGVFTSILSMLSLAELGIGTSIIFNLYKPLAENNYSETKALLVLYKKIYTVIAFVVLFIGLSIIPFLSKIIGEGVNLPHVYWIYLLFLTNSVVSYLYTYNRSLYSADQKNYVNITIDFLFYLLVSIIQIVILITGLGFIFYLIVQVIGTLFANIVISFKSKKDYKKVYSAKNSELSAEIKIKLKKLVIGNMSNKLGSVIVMGSDNILISSFVGLSTVGIYSNYSLIIDSLSSVITNITNSITASLGNMAVLAPEKGEHIFYRHSFINFTINYFCSVLLLSLFNPFIKIWAGNQYIFSQKTVLIIVIYFVVKRFRMTPLLFIDAYGLAWEQKYKSIFESILNIIFSLFFLIVLDLGVEGVLLGTICSSLAFVSWYEPIIVFKYGLKKSMKRYWKETVLQWSLVIVSLTLIMILHKSIIVDGIIGFCVYLLIGVIVAFIPYLAVYFRNENFKYLRDILLHMIRK